MDGVGGSSGSDGGTGGVGGNVGDDDGGDVGGGDVGGDSCRSAAVLRFLDLLDALLVRWLRHWCLPWWSQQAKVVLTQVGESRAERCGWMVWFRDGL